MFCKDCAEQLGGLFRRRHPILEGQEICGICGEYRPVQTRDVGERPNSYYAECFEVAAKALLESY